MVELSFECRIEKNGEKAIFLSMKKPLYDPETHEVIGIIGTSVNITDQKKTQSISNTFTASTVSFSILLTKLPRKIGSELIFSLLI